MPTAPDWFSYEWYFNNKLAQAQKADPQGNWDYTKLTEVFEKDGFTVDADGMYRHGRYQHFSTGL